MRKSLFLFYSRKKKKKNKAFRTKLAAHIQNEEKNFKLNMFIYLFNAAQEQTRTYFSFTYLISSLNILSNYTFIYSDQIIMLDDTVRPS